jgi:hypothetical protein
MTGLLGLLSAGNRSLARAYSTHPQNTGLTFNKNQHPLKSMSTATDTYALTDLEHTRSPYRDRHSHTSQSCSLSGSCIAKKKKEKWYYPNTKKTKITSNITKKKLAKHHQKFLSRSHNRELSLFPQSYSLQRFSSSNRGMTTCTRRT